MVFLMRAFRRFSAVCPRRRYFILFIVTVIMPIVILLHLEPQFLYGKRSVFLVSNRIYTAASTEISPPRRSSFQRNEGQILSSRVQKFSNFIVELNNSEPRQFDSGVLNFSYTYNHFDLEQAFSKEFSGYDSFPTSETSPTYSGYVSVMYVGQELSQCTRHLLNLCLYASTSKRKVVTPRMSNGGMHMNGRPFSEFFNVSRLNKQLRRFGYSELAMEDEFWRNCDNERKKVVVVFYQKPFAKSRPRYFGFPDKFDMYERVKKHGMVNCTAEVTGVPNMLKKYRNNTDFYCIDKDLFGNEQAFNEKVLGDSKCVFINSWNELYNVHWFRMKRPGAPVSFKLLYWFLDPSHEIVNEASVFREMRIERPYVAIHIRGVKFKNKTFLRPCFDIALEFVNALRRTRKVKTLFLSTDMSQFGGITNKDKNSHELLAQRSGAVIYNPNVAKMLKGMDRWKVSLTEVRLLTQSDHLITIGQGSFGTFIRSRYLWEHRNKLNWTLATLCMKTAKRYF